MAKVRRIYDAKTLNRICNRPDILPFVAPGCAYVDITGFFKRKGNMALKYGRAVMLFALCRKGEYEIHYLIPSDIRGKEGLAAVRKIVDLVFTKHRAKAILGAVALDHMPSRVFSRALGALPVGRCHDASGRECIRYRLECIRWATLPKNT